MNCCHAFLFAEASLAFVSGFRAQFSKLTILDRGIYVQYKMVVLTLVLQNNGETIFFDQAIPQVHFMKLISCSLYNSWHNLKTVGQIQFKEDREVLASIPQGHYTYRSLAEELTQSLKILQTKKMYKLKQTSLILC